MAQNVTIMGASYPDVPAVELPKTGGGTALFADPSVTTAQPEDVAAGKVFLNAQGEPTEGTGSGGGIIDGDNLAYGGPDSAIVGIGVVGQMQL